MTISHTDKSTYTSQCILSTKRITYFIQTKYEQVWIIYMNEQMKQITKININSVKLKLCQKM